MEAGVGRKWREGREVMNKDNFSCSIVTYSINLRAVTTDEKEQGMLSAPCEIL